MGSLSELVDFGDKGMARKFVSHKKQGGKCFRFTSLTLFMSVYRVLT